MPIQYRIDRERGFVISTFTGAVSGEEYVEHPLELARDPAVPRPLREVIDTRRVAQIDLGAAQLPGLSARLPELFSALRGARLALLVSTDPAPAVRGLYDLVAGLSGMKLRITRDWDAALAFLEDD